jgi:hypothetical protein
MPEIELHTESGESDPFGKRVGVLAAVMAVLLAVVTIASHRAHTAAVVERTEANDQWTFYQSKKLKFHNLELGDDLLNLLGRDRAGVPEAIARYKEEQKRYDKESVEIQDEARKKEEETKLTEAKALRYDLGEGLLEIAVVLSSIYFIARRRIFPLVGGICGVLGCGLAVTGVLL